MTAYARATDPVSSWEAAETWKPIPGWEDLYEVSDQGRVRSLDRIDSRGWRRKGQILRANPNSCGYPSVQLFRDAKRRSVKVHTLVLEAFVGSCPPGMEACHWNDTKDDNRLSNLRWGTPSENQLDLVRNGRHKNAEKTHCLNGHPFDEKNTYVNPASGKRACRACQSVFRKRYEASDPERIRQMNTLRKRNSRNKETDHRTPGSPRRSMILQPTRKEETPDG